MQKKSLGAKCSELWGSASGTGTGIRAEHAEIEAALRILHARRIGQDTVAHGQDTVAHEVDPSKLPVADELLDGERRLGD